MSVMKRMLCVKHKSVKKPVADTDLALYIYLILMEEIYSAILSRAFPLVGLDCHTSA